MTDYIKALENEIKLKPIIEKYFNLELTHTERYDIFDFYDDNNYFELKCRNCNSNKYNDLMMNVNKWNKGIDYLNFNKNVYYVFEFFDGLFYYKQDINDDFRMNKYLGKYYIYIPNEKLTKIIVNNNN
jgi:hypothetical protein|tara:strand:+ start:979 stop:1362 length:384 start_codon:yes stop_codon:yes gene_type:complete